MALHIYDHDNWKQVRIQLLKRIIVLAQARHSSPGGATRSDRACPPGSSNSVFARIFVTQALGRASFTFLQRSDISCVWCRACEQEVEGLTFSLALLCSVLGQVIHTNILCADVPLRNYSPTHSLVLEAS